VLQLVTSANLVTAISFSGNSSEAPAEIVFLPEGSHKIFPLSNKNGIQIHIPADKGEAIAAALNKDLQKRMSDPVKPWTDFEHTRKFPASAYPTSFRYEKGKGVMAAMDWSKSGRDAVEGRDVRYFSPEFYVDSNGFPTGLPLKGPIGGLVTEPAFRDIGAIAASESHQTNTTNMTLVYASLSISAAAENAETEAVKAIENLKVKAADADRLETENKDLKTKVEAAEAKEVEAVKQRASDLVSAAVTDGRLLAKDTEKQDKFREKISAGDSFAEEILAQLPKLNDELGNPIVKAGAAAGQDSETRVTAALTSARTELGESAGFQIVWERAAEIDPQAFA